MLESKPNENLVAEEEETSKFRERLVFAERELGDSREHIISLESEIQNHGKDFYFKEMIVFS